MNLVSRVTNPIRRAVSSVNKGVSNLTSGAKSAYGTVQGIPQGVGQGVQNVGGAITGMGSAQGIGGAANNALSMTFSPEAYKNPQAVLNAYGNVGQQAYSPLKPIVESTGAGRNLSDWTKGHQNELWTAASTLPTAGGSAIPLAIAATAAGGQAMRDKKRAEEIAADAEDRAAADLERRQSDLVNQVRSQFGSTGVTDARQAAQNAAYQQNMQQASGTLQDALTRQRIQAAQSGQTGGTLDTAGQSNAIANYYRQMAQGAVNAAQIGNQFDNALQQQRIATENAIYNSGAADLSGQNAELMALLNSAGRGQMANNILSTALPNMANMGASYLKQQAAGG